ncbi:hypothetical protein XCR_4468 [Xanthomonas campestris pv. raphani 756C]|nr:hypothetical protein XCR_4468 [Xanthomonas campestris pv. raphani 756C]
MKRGAHGIHQDRNGNEARNFSRFAWWRPAPRLPRARRPSCRVGLATCTRRGDFSLSTTVRLVCMRPAACAGLLPSPAIHVHIDAAGRTHSGG